MITCIPVSVYVDFGHLGIEIQLISLKVKNCVCVCDKQLQGIKRSYWVLSCLQQGYIIRGASVPLLPVQ